MAPLNAQQFSPYITPERRRDVERHMPPVYVGSSPNEAMPTRMTPDNPHGAVAKMGIKRMLEQHRVARAIMRSDVPTEHLKGIESINTGKRLSPGTRMQTVTYMGTMKDYSTPTPEVLAHKGNSVIQVSHHMKAANHADRDEQQRDMVHEIGHHNDALSTDQFTSVGVKEATAENYADQYKGATKTSPEPVYDDPKNMALTRGQKASYAKVRVRPSDES